MSRPLASFSLLSMYYDVERKQKQQQKQTKKIKIKPKTTHTQMQMGCPGIVAQEKQEVHKKKITIMIKRKECKLLPIENEITYEENIDNASEQKSAPQPTSTSTSPKTNNISKPKFVSDAQRARIASEPVALLREKLAKQYGMIKKN